MASKTATTLCNLSDFQLEAIIKWLSCNGELCGVGPTVVFASAAALFLYSELETTIVVVGDHVHVSALERTLISTMVLGMLALMTHLWVCSMRFFQYYLDTLIRDSPNVLLEMTTAGLLGTQTDMVPLGSMTKFLRSQQPQIHITICWFLSLCYADYVRKNYCQSFNMPYLEQWQSELQARLRRAARRTMDQLHSFVDALHRRLRGSVQEPRLQPSEPHTVATSPKRCKSEMVGESHRSSLFDGRRGSSDTYCIAPYSQETVAKELCVRLLGQSSETAVDDIEMLVNHIQLVEWAKCGESYISLIPTVLWAVGAAALAQRLLSSLFRRFLFRRVPMWEIMLQNLLFIWMVIYSLHFWTVLVTVVKILVEYCYQESFMIQPMPEDAESEKLMQQWVIWMCGAVPLAVYIHTRPRPVSPPMMLWITANPWQRREMGPYGYYLNRPLTSLQSFTTLGRQQAKILRKAFSDSNLLIKEPPKRKRHSKSI